MNYILGKDRNQVRVECTEDYVDVDSEVRIIDIIIDALNIESLGFSRELTSSRSQAPSQGLIGKNTIEYKMREPFAYFTRIRTPCLVNIKNLPFN